MTTLSELAVRVATRNELPPPTVRRALRTAAGCSLEEVAEVVGVTRQAVTLWEGGARTPRGANLEAYVEVLRTLRQAMVDS